MTDKKPDGPASTPEQTIEERIRDLVCEHLSVAPEEVSLEARFDGDLNADSLDKMELVMAIEEAFDITVAEEETERLLTVGDAVAFVEGRSGG